MNPPTLLLHPAGPVCHITLNRPEQRNAMNAQMVTELRAALGAAQADGQTRVVVLRGAGRHFCAGADLQDLAAARARLAEHPEALAEHNAAFGDLCVDFANSGLAIVAVLQGTVMGGGLGLACVADVAIADESASFRLPETSLGLVPAQIAPYLVERVGYSEARRLAVTGGRLDAQQAAQLRLVHEVHAADQLETALNRVLAQILQCAPGALAATKQLISRSRFMPSAALVHDAAQVFAQAALGAEGIEGTGAFLARRKAAWMPQ